MSVGFGLDEWQEQVLEAAMGERSDGRWASKFVGLSVPRQNGKSQLIVARALAGILLFGEKMIIISAHETDTARQVWKRLLDVIESNPTLEKRVSGRMDAINREYLSFGKGEDRQEIRLKARRKSGTRGFSADCLLLDEAQILGKSAWGSIMPTMSARSNPQMWLFGTPPTEEDDPFAFQRVRESSLAHKARHCWLEWSAKRDDDYDSVETWAAANPSFGVRISEEACADDRAAMDDQQFSLERLGIWDEGQASASVVPKDVWRNLISLGPEGDVRPTALAVDMSHAGQISVSACWVDGEHAHGELVWSGTQLDPAVEWLTSRARPRIPVVIDNASPAAAMIPMLRARKVRVTESSAGDMAKACQQFVSKVFASLFSHAGQVEVDEALEGARKRPIREAGGWGWDRRDDSVNIAPLVSLTLALYGASTTRRPGSGGRSTRSGREAVVM